MSTTTGGVRIVDMPDLGAFNSASSLVGERAGSGRFSASGLTNYLNTSYLQLAGGTMSGNLTNSGTISANVFTADTVGANTVNSTTINNGGTVTTDTLHANSMLSTDLTVGHIENSGAYSLSVSGGYITVTGTTVTFAMDSAGWRWEYVRSNGTMRWISGATGQVLMSIDNAGNLICRGTITPSGTPA